MDKQKTFMQEMLWKTNFSQMNIKTKNTNNTQMKNKICKKKSQLNNTGNIQKTPEHVTRKQQHETNQKTHEKTKTILNATKPNHQRYTQNGILDLK